jgi:hypothetical protein
MYVVTDHHHHHSPLLGAMMMVRKAGRIGKAWEDQTMKASELLGDTDAAVETVVPKVADPFQKAVLLLLGNLVHAIERGTTATCELRDAVSDLNGNLCGEERHPDRKGLTGLAEVCAQFRGGLLVEIDGEGK